MIQTRQLPGRPVRQDATRCRPATRRTSCRACSFGPGFFEPHRQQRADVSRAAGRSPTTSRSTSAARTWPLYSVNPPPEPDRARRRRLRPRRRRRPVLRHRRSASRTSSTPGSTPGGTWTSPIVRMRVGEPVEQTIVDYRTDNGIDAYPSAAAKLGSRLDTLVAGAADQGRPARRALPPFKDWARRARRAAVARADPPGRVRARRLRRDRPGRAAARLEASGRLDELPQRR